MTDANDRRASQVTRLAEAIAAGRPVGRSHRLHRPRGGFCARGYCQQCPLDSGSLACEMSGGNGRPRGRRLDPVRPLGWVGERMEPWFYETRFLRPAFARQPALEALRRLSAAHRLPPAPPVAGGPGRGIETDVAVIGGGPAGVAAAAAAAATTSVIVVTRGPLGGSLPLEPALATRVNDDVVAIRRSDAMILEHALCVGRFDDENRIVVVTRNGPVTIRATRIVVATGAYDRSLLLRGVDLPGVVGLRGFQLLAAQHVLHRRMIGVIGTGEELRRSLATGSTFGLPIRWVAGVRVAGDVEDEVDVHHAAVRSITGRRRARGVVLDDGMHLGADLVVLATTQPTYELQLQLGAMPSVDGSPPVIRPVGDTSMPALVVGEAAGWADPIATPDRADDAVSAWLAGADPARTDPVRDGPLLAAPSPDAVVCVCEDVRQRDIDRAIDDGFGDVELVKRRSGATTGACQGKLCMPVVAEAFARRGLPPSVTTVRPPIRPVRVADLGGVP